MSSLAAGPLSSSVTYKIELPDGGGNFELKQVKTMSITDNRTGETIIGGNGPIGNTFAGGGSTGTMEVVRQVRVPDEVDYFGLADSRAEFVLSMQDSGADTFGTRYTWNRVQVNKVDIEGANDGNQTMSVEWMTASKIQITQPEPAA